MPGGETKVCLRFDRICAGGDDAFFLCCDESSSECALSCGDGGVEVGCKITPTPNLLAEPSRPRAIMVAVGRCAQAGVVSREVEEVEVDEAREF